MGCLDRREVRRRLARRQPTCEGSLPSPGTTKIVHGARAGDIEQPALFGDGLGTACMGDRDEAILEPGQEDDSPFETLGAMKCHEVDGVTGLAGRIGTQARFEPRHERACASAGVVSEVLQCESVELGEILGRSQRSSRQCRRPVVRQGRRRRQCCCQSLRERRAPRATPESLGRLPGSSSDPTLDGPKGARGTRGHLRFGKECPGPPIRVRTTPAVRSCEPARPCSTTAPPDCARASVRSRHESLVGIGLVRDNLPN